MTHIYQKNENNYDFIIKSIKDNHTRFFNKLYKNKYKLVIDNINKLQKSNDNDPNWSVYYDSNSKSEYNSINIFQIGSINCIICGNYLIDNINDPKRDLKIYCSNYEHFIISNKISLKLSVIELLNTYDKTHQKHYLYHAGIRSILPFDDSLSFIYDYLIQYLGIDFHMYTFNISPINCLDFCCSCNKYNNQDDDLYDDDLDDDPYDDLDDDHYDDLDDDI
jgi:hypothetical protein